MQDILTNPLLMFVPIGLIFYFLVMRPQQQRQKEHRAAIDNLQALHVRRSVLDGVLLSSLGSGLKESTRAKLVGLNAARVFRFPVPEKYR